VIDPLVAASTTAGAGRPTDPATALLTARCGCANVAIEMPVVT
jgi:hypothetical protein